MTYSGHTGRKFVGRQRELSALKEAMDAAAAGSGQMAMLAGEPGIGKTRTVKD